MHILDIVQNSISAGATKIEVLIRIDTVADRLVLEVKDDGCGMSETDARLAFERHATSKIRSLDDIYHLASFGFRGEALPSIASIAEVEVRTRMHDQELGTQVSINGGRFLSQEPVQTPFGTQFLVKNLFNPLISVTGRRSEGNLSITDTPFTKLTHYFLYDINKVIELQLISGDGRRRRDELLAY